MMLLFLLLSGCGGDSADDRQTGPRVTVVEVARVRAQDVQILVRSVGSLKAIDRVGIAPEMPGTVANIHFEENSEVEKGELLVELDTRKLELEVQSARESLETAKAERELAKATVRRTKADVENRRSQFERDKELYESGITSEAQYIQSKTAFESAEAAVAEAEASLRRAGKRVEAARTMLKLDQERLRDAFITAPFAGILGERLVSPGDYVEPGQPLVELVVMDPIEIAFSVPERYRGKIETGQQILFETPAVPNRSFSGYTTYISPSADSATRSLKLKARLSNEESVLQPGFFGAVRLILETHPDAAVIPESAIVPRGEEKFVYVVNNSVAHLRKIVPGEFFDASVEVLEGLQTGETVIIAGQQKVADGYPVKIRDAGEGKSDEQAETGAVSVS